MMNEQSYFEGRVHDLISRWLHGELMVFSSYLTAEEAALSAIICKKSKVPYMLYGGYEDSERKILAISDMEHEVLRQCFPLALIQFEGDVSQLTNRDVLGALMSCGIRRDVLGDIIVRDGLVLVFVAEHIKEFIFNNVATIGRKKGDS